MKGVKDALSRLSGVKKVTVKLQENRVIVETDPHQPIRPSSIWKAILHVGFVPENMEVWARGTLEAQSFAVGEARWPWVKPGPSDGGERRVHLRVADGAGDPPRVEFVE